MRVEYGEQVDYGKDRGMFKTVGDEEHVQFVNEYFDGVSMRRLARKLKRSSVTIMNQIHSHNAAVAKEGYCVRCRRLKGKHEIERARPLVDFVLTLTRILSESAEWFQHGQTVL